MSNNGTIQRHAARLLRTEHLTKLYPDGQVNALVDVIAGDPPRRVRFHHGPQRQRQIDALEPARRAGRAHLGRNLLRRPARVEDPQPGPAAGPEDRLRLPVVLPAAGALGHGERAGAHVRGPLPAADAAAARPPSCWRSWAWATASTTCRSKLSVGERQRVAIARALANDPVVLLADEPTGNLDSKSAAGIFDLFAKLHRERGMTIVLITHDDALGRRAERIVRMQDGRLRSDGPSPGGRRGRLRPPPSRPTATASVRTPARRTSCRRSPCPTASVSGTRRVPFLHNHRAQGSPVSYQADLARRELAVRLLSAVCTTGESTRPRRLPR